MWALETAPCAATLRELDLSCYGDWDEANLAALGGLMGAGGLPALEVLTVDSAIFDAELIAAFLEALGPPSPLGSAAPAPVALKVLHVNTPLRDGAAGMGAVAAAIERGALGSRLEELGLYFRVEDEGLTALTRVLRGGGRCHLAQLRSLSVNAYGGVSDAVADEFSAVAAASCPKLVRVTLRASLGESRGPESLMNTW